MSHADYLEDGADYYDLYGDDCDGDCNNCLCVDCDEHPEYKRKQRAIRLQNQIRHHEF